MATFACDMLRAFTAFLLMIAVLTANLSNCMIYAGFDLNQKYIASTLCENRDKPQLQCNGKCYLAKKIKQAEEKEKNDEQQSQKNRFQEALITQKLILSFQQAPRPELIVVEQPVDLPQHSGAIFHPPRLA